MKIRHILTLCASCIAMAASAQSIQIYRNGQVMGSYELEDIDSISFDHRPNLWNQAEVNVSYYYAPNGSQTDDPETTFENGIYTVPLTKATFAQWQAQMFFVTDIATDSHKKYDFTVTLTASKRIGNATVKLYQNGQDGLYYFSEQITLTANQEYVFTKTGMDGIDMSQLALVLDFGGNTAQTNVTISNLRIKESDYDSSLNPECPLEGYDLVWHDEFTARTVSSLRWTYEKAEAGWVNEELQNYVESRTPQGNYVTEVNDGILKIRALKEGNKVYSARIYGNKSKGFKYGYFEARLKLPQGRGTWPAFWMMPVSFSSWPADGEIDIMEEVGYNPNKVSSSIHCNAYNHQQNTQKTHEMTCQAAEQSFHVYALEWTEDYIRTYVDGKVQLYFENDKLGNKDTWPFDKAFYPILNLAWGGTWGGLNGVDESALPATLEVDYVRVWQKK